MKITNKKFNDILDLITRDECSFNENYLGITSDNEEYTLVIEYDINSDALIKYTLYIYEDEIFLTEKQEKELIKKCKEILFNDIYMVEELNKLQRERINSICESAYFIR